MNVIGRSVPRFDGHAKVTGRALFTGDLSVPGMVPGLIVRSAAAHGRLRGVRSEDAERIPGVLAVLTGADLAGTDPYYGHAVKDRPVIAIDKVRYIGEPVAAVAAADLLTARAAAEQIVVEVEELPPVFDLDEALAPGASRIHEGPPGFDQHHGPDVAAAAAPNVCYHEQYAWGNVDRGFADADAVFEDTFTFPAVYHYAMEPYAVVASGDRDGITVWASAQHPFLVRAELAAIFHLPLDRVRVIVPYVGGGYGSKSYTKIEPLVAALARKAQRPVRVVCSVQEAMLTNRRHAARIRLRTGVRRDGRLVARDCTIRLDTGAYADNGPRVANKIATRILGGYRCPHVRVDVSAVYTNTSPAGSFRSIGGPQAAWATESQMDMIAERLALDPLEVRHRNLLGEGEQVQERFRPLDTNLARGLQRTADAIGWGNAAPRGRGTGIALGLADSGANPAAAALVRMHHDGSVTVHESSTELGQGARTVLAQIAAEELELPLEQVGVVASDTAVTPYDRSTGASRSTTLMGLAVQAACRDLRDQLLGIAAQREGADRGALSTAGGAVVTPSGARHEYGDLIRAFYETPGGELIGRGYVLPSFDRGRLRRPPVFWEVGWGAAQVEVDEETGVVRLSRYVGVADVGRAINPALCEGQDEGAAMQGIGHTFWEAMLYEDGQLLNGSLVEYRVPTFEDLPDAFETVLLEDGNGPGPYGAKGMGEGGVGPVAPAVAAAVARAVGARIRDLPLTPERVWRAIRRAR
jgi:CO/xanthine dehydrogenase Mo-binding subunit